MKPPILSIIFVVIFLSGIFLNIISHEQAHQAIFTSYGIDSSIHYRGAYFQVSPENMTYASKMCNETCLMLHSQNEIVGYNTQGLFVLIGAGLLFIILLIELGQNDMHEKQNKSKIPNNF